MNTYRIEMQAYRAKNEYEAVKKAYNMATSWELMEYLGRNRWAYNVTFKHGKAVVVVSKLEVI